MKSKMIKVLHVLMRSMRGGGGRAQYVVIQGALLGKPIVSFDVEGVREVIKDGENGYVVSLKDTEKW